MPQSVVETDDEYVRDLEDPLETMADRLKMMQAGRRALLAEIQALRVKCEALKRKVRHLKQQLDAPMFRNMVEHTDPDVSPDDSQFSTD